ncbi:MAG: bifunctional molybdenum cofactor biosynthesis protein MoaC/MoaB [Bacteroidetes bacterium]|nr:bifunctional molybdenum cofactor biosynthesis protein MoaC/MoaB [Bacteroidota bacterium]
MIDISGKITTQRTAIAGATIKVSAESLSAIKDNSVPKGDVFATAKAAGLFAVKNTCYALPHCHPISVDFTGFRFSTVEKKSIINIECEVTSIARTGCEMEALHGVSVAALTVYDMLKPIDKSIEILSVRLIEKRGGKSDYLDKFKKDLSAAVVVASDSISQGTKEDKAGKAIVQKLERLSIKVADYCVIPDEVKIIRKRTEGYCNEGIDIVLITGGTGLSPRDATPEAIRPLIEREVPGIMEAARAYGQQRTPFAMLSRGIAGMKDRTLIITMPGSTRGASETMDALFPFILHVFRVTDMNFRHGKKKG